MSNIAALTTPPSIPNLPTEAQELSPQELFDRAAAMTGSYYRGDPLSAGTTPEEIVMGSIASFGGDPSITSLERGVLLAQVADMKIDGVITMDEARNFANEVAGMTQGLRDYR